MPIIILPRLYFAAAGEAARQPMKGQYLLNLYKCVLGKEFLCYLVEVSIQTEDSTNSLTSMLTPPSAPSSPLPLLVDLQTQHEEDYFPPHFEEYRQNNVFNMPIVDDVEFANICQQYIGISNDPGISAKDYFLKEYDKLIRDLERELVAADYDMDHYDVLTSCQNGTLMAYVKLALSFARQCTAPSTKLAQLKHPKTSNKRISRSVLDVQASITGCRRSARIAKKQSSVGKKALPKGNSNTRVQKSPCQKPKEKVRSQKKRRTGT